MKTAAFALTLLTISPVALADNGHDFTGPENCKVARFSLDDGERIAWDGPCKDGYASGPGYLHRYKGLWEAMRYEVTMVRGEISGEGEIKYPNRDKYIGNLRDGMPEGKGYKLYAETAAQYLGDFHNGMREGSGNYLDGDHSRYVGQWKAGKRDGIGVATFAVGGAYEGSWKADKFDGRGMITYAGSGRREQAMFVDGHLADRPAPAASKPGHFSQHGSPELGSRIPLDSVIDFVPSDKSYAELTPAQQALIKGQYKALEDGDEPPYPLHGKKRLLELVAKEQGKFWGDGLLRVNVLVGKDGTVLSVTAIGSPSADLTNNVSLVLGKEKYKPAICHGEPCEMIFPINFAFERK